MGVLAGATCRDSCRYFSLGPIGHGPAIPTYRGASHDFTMDAELSSGLKALAKAHGATLYMVLLAAFQVLLSYHTGQEDLLVGSPMVGRSRAEFEGIVGLFTNPVVLRANLSGNPTFRAFLEQVRHTVLSASGASGLPHRSIG